MGKTLLNLGEAAIESLSVSEKKKQLRERLRKKEKLLTNESNLIKSKFNSARVSAVMDVATKIFGVLGITIYTSLDSSLCFFQPNVSHDVLCI